MDGGRGCVDPVNAIINKTGQQDLHKATSMLQANSKAKAACILQTYIEILCLASASCTDTCLVSDMDAQAVAESPHLLCALLLLDATALIAHACMHAV